MATHDYIISNASGAAVRADLNNALAAIATNNSSATEPTTTYAYQWWADTGSSPTVMKLRNAANSGWITLFQLDGEWTVVPFENGTAAAPSIYFKDSGTDTGLFSGGTDQVNISTGGTERVEWGTSEVVFNDVGNNYDFRVEGDTNANLFFVDASADRIGIGTASPSVELDVRGEIKAGNGTVVPIVSYSSTNTIFGSSSGHPLAFVTSNTERARLDTSGRLLVGTSSSIESTSKLQVKDGSLNIYHASAAAGAGYAIFFTTDGSSSALAQAKIEGLQETANTSGGRLVFSTSASGSGSPTERMRIANDGSITSTIAATNTANSVFNATSTSYISTQISINNYTAAGTGFNFLQCWSGNFSSERLKIIGNGNVQNANGSYTTLSDAKLKENIVDASSQWDDLKAIQIRNWNFKEETGHETHRQIGPIAQELEIVCPGLVFETPDRDEDGNETGEVTKGVNQSVLYMKAVKALQEAMERIEALEAKVAALEAA